MLPVAPWAKKYVRVPFKDGGRDMAGVDCYGLHYLIEKQEFNRLIPAHEGIHFNCADVATIEGLIASRKSGWRRLSHAEIGCAVLLLVQNLPAHMGVYIGSDHFIHAQDRGSGAGYVEEGRIGSSFWPRKSVEGYYRYG